MLGPALAVSAVRVVAEMAILASLSALGDTVETTDTGDLLNPASWSLTLDPSAQVGTLLPGVARVASLDGGTSGRTFSVALDARLVPGAPYLLALAPTARATSGATTLTTAASVAGKTSAGVAAQDVGVPAGDVVSPPVASLNGDLPVWSRERALRERVLLLVARVRLGAFSHLPDAGRAFEAKRTYSPVRLAAIAGQIRAQLLEDDEVRDAVAGISGPDGSGVVTFDVRVQPRFAPQPIQVIGPLLPYPRGDA